MAKNGYLIDAFWISQDAVQSLEYLKLVVTAGQKPVWLPVKTLEEWRKTPEASRAIKVNDKVIEKPADIFLVDEYVLMNPTLYISPAGKLEAGTSATIPTSPKPGPVVPHETHKPGPVVPHETHTPKQAEDVKSGS